MDRKYMHSSSMSRAFFSDFPDEQEMPLMLNELQRACYCTFVEPLLDLQPTPDPDAVVQAAQTMIGVFDSDIVGVPGSGNSRLALTPLQVYEATRAAAEYIQSTFALCSIEAAASCSALAQGTGGGFFASLAALSPAAADELLVEELRRRFVANQLAHLTPSCCCQLGCHPAVQAAASTAATSSCSDNPDVLQLPAAAGYAFADAAAGGSSSSSSGSSHSPAGPGVGVYRPFQLQVQWARHHGSGSAGGCCSILRRAAWKRALSRGSSHYLAPLLGKDGAGTVLLVGGSLASVIKGLQPTHSAGPAGASNASSSSTLAFVGFASAAAAQAALDGCLTEVLTRYFKRHPVLLTDPQGRPVSPLAVTTRHHLLLLLPEPTQPLLPAVAPVAAAAVAAAADAGADVPAAAAAAAAAPAAPTAAVTGFRDVLLVFDLALHPSTEALLLGASSALGAFAWDGDEVSTLPSAVRALASGGLLINPADLARGAAWSAEPAPAGEAAAEPAAGGGASSWSIAGGLTAAGAAAAAREVAGAAAAGWQPLLLLPPADPAIAGPAGGAVTAPLLERCCSSAGLALQLPMLPGTLGRARWQQLQLLAQRNGICTNPLHQELLVADVGCLLQLIGASAVLPSLLDVWPPVARPQSDEAAWQQQLAAGRRWWQHLSLLLGGLQLQQQQRSSIRGLDWLDLCERLSSPAVSKDRYGGPVASSAAMDLSPEALIQSPHLLRSLLDQNMQQPGGGDAAAGGQQLRLRERLQLLQQLRSDQGWAWGSVEQQQGQQGLPSHVASVVLDRWWPGPVLRGSRLEGPVVECE